MPPIDRHRALVIAAFAAIYLIWGSTYLAIRFAIETLPPFLMAGSRFLLGGLILYGWARLRGAARPRREHWQAGLAVGGLMLFGGNGLVTWAEQTVPSGVAALLITTVPLWMVLLDWLLYRGSRPTPVVWFGLVAGLLGVGVLAGPTGDEVRAVAPMGALALLLASFLWANGSLLSRRLELPKPQSMAVAVQLIAGASVLILFGSMRGEWALIEPSAVSTRSLLSVAYLVVFGSIVAFTAYTWLLRVTSAASVGTYAFVNPVIAVLLGWAFADEVLTTRAVVAGGLIVGAVVLIHWARQHEPARSTVGDPTGGPAVDGEPGPVSEAA